jgi:chromosome segregation ATPase
MSNGREDAAAGLASGLEAAGALIESLEEEVAGLRRDLESATAALRNAQEEIGSRTDMEGEASSLRAELSDLRRRYSDEQLRMSNEHIAEIAAVRRRLEEQHRTDVEAASSQTRVEEIKEEFAHERAVLEERHRAEVAQLKASSEIWEEELRTKYQEQESRHAAEIEAVRRAGQEGRGDPTPRRRGACGPRGAARGRAAGAQERGGGPRARTPERLPGRRRDPGGRASVA